MLNLAGFIEKPYFLPAGFFGGLSVWCGTLKLSQKQRSKSQVGCPIQLFVRLKMQFWGYFLGYGPH